MTPTEQAVEIRDPLSPHLLAHPFLEGGVGSLMAKAASAYQEDYEMTSDEGADHAPTEFEGWLLEDFWNGLLGEESFFGPVRLLISALTALQARVGELEAGETRWRETAITSGALITSLRAELGKFKEAAAPIVAEIAEYPPSMGEDDEEVVEVSLGDIKHLRRLLTPPLEQE